MKRTVLLILCILTIIPFSLRSSSAQNVISFVDSGQELGDLASYDAELGDLDGDGDLDAYVSNRGDLGPTLDNPDTVWLNNGAGLFTDSGQALGETVTYKIALGDVDNDGDLDAFVGNFGPNQVWLNAGNATFTDSGQTLGNASSLDLALGDLDGDGDLDAVVANGSTGESSTVWLNQGGIQGGTVGVFVEQANALNSLEDTALALGDLDGDGDLDAFTAKRSIQNANQLWLNNGTGIFTDSGQSLGLGLTRAIALGDLDGDDDLDAFIANEPSAAPSVPSEVWLNQGGRQGGTVGQFANSGQNDVTGSAADIALGDLDDDGDLDAFFANFNFLAGGAPNGVWSNDGNGQFVLKAQLGQSISYGVALGDLDGDEDLDAFIANFKTFTSQPDKVWWNESFPGDDPTADLAVDIAPVGSDINSVDSSLDYVIHVSNNGPDPVDFVELNVELPIPEFDKSSYFSYTWSHQAPQAVCTTPQPLSEPLGCQLGTLMPNARVTLFLTIDHSSTAGELTTSVKTNVSGLQGDPDPSNNRDQTTMTFIDCEKDTLCTVERIICEIIAERADATDSDQQLHSLQSQPAQDTFAPDLALYYQVRDDILSTTPSGQEYADLYYQHSLEMVALLASDEALRNDMLTALELWEPSLQALVQENGAAAVITDAQVQALERVLNRLAEIGSPALQQAIATERAELPALSSFVGLTMNEANDTVVTANNVFAQETLYLPLMQR